MGRKVEIADLIDAGEVAELLGLSRATSISVYQRRYPDMPRPVVSTLNALNGATAQDAFSVRCDESTMTQNDLDTGNLIALVTFTAAATLETLHVQMAVETGGTSVQEIAANISSAASSLSNSAGSSLAGMN